MMQPSELQTYQAEIDGIDAKIVGLLAERFLLTSKIGKLKSLHALDPKDPAREAQQETQLRDLAKRHQLNPDLVVQIFRAVIDEVVRNHQSAR